MIVGLLDRVMLLISMFMIIFFWVGLVIVMLIVIIECVVYVIFRVFLGLGVED